MADKKISQLSAASTPLAGTELLPIVQSSTTDNITVNNLLGSASTTGNYQVIDNMPPGLTISGTPSGTGWTCTSSTTTQVNCTSSTVIASGDPQTVRNNEAVRMAYLGHD